VGGAKLRNVLLVASQGTFRVFVQPDAPLVSDPRSEETPPAVEVASVPVDGDARDAYMEGPVVMVL
jgi:hypothetical protein